MGVAGIEAFAVLGLDMFAFRPQSHVNPRHSVLIFETWAWAQLGLVKFMPWKPLTLLLQEDLGKVHALELRSQPGLEPTKLAT